MVCRLEAPVAFLAAMACSIIVVALLTILTANARNREYMGQEIEDAMNAGAENLQFLRRRAETGDRRLDPITKALTKISCSRRDYSTVEKEAVEDLFDLNMATRAWASSCGELSTPDGALFGGRKLGRHE